MHLDTHQTFDPFDRKTSLEREPRQGRSTAAQGGVLTALIMIMVGAVLLLHELGVIPRQYVPHLLPMLFMLGGILLVVKLIPPEIMAEHRALAAAALERPVSRNAAIVVALIWLACITLAGWVCYRFFVR